MSIGRTAVSRVAFALLPVLAASACAQATAPRINDTPSYFEFGVVTSLGQRSVELQTFDQQRQTSDKHSFSFSSDTQADSVHVGDPVEIIYVLNGAEPTLRRMIALYAGIPKAGPPASIPVLRPKALPHRAPARAAAVIPVPSAPPVVAPTTSASSSKAVALGGSSIPKLAPIVPTTLAAEGAAVPTLRSQA